MILQSVKLATNQKMFSFTEAQVAQWVALQDARQDALQDARQDALQVVSKKLGIN